MYTGTYLKYLPTELRSELRLLKESCTFRVNVDFEKDYSIITIEDSLFRMKFSIDPKDARDLISSISRNTSSRLISLGSVDFLELNLPYVFYDPRIRQFKFLNPRIEIRLNDELLDLFRTILEKFSDSSIQVAGGTPPYTFTAEGKETFQMKNAIISTPSFRAEVNVKELENDFLEFLNSLLSEPDRDFGNIFFYYYDARSRVMQTTEWNIYLPACTELVDALMEISQR